MATTTYSGFDVSEIDAIFFQGLIDFFAAATIPDGSDASVFTDIAPTWLWNADSNTNRLKSLSFIYTMIMNSDAALGPISTNMFFGYECITDTEFAAGTLD